MTATARDRVLIAGGIVVDVRDGSQRPDTDVLIAGGTIVRVSPAAERPAEPDAVVVDARGKYLVPGYNDMHAHALGVADAAPGLELMLAHGITGFRQMAGSDALLRRRAEGRLSLPAAAPALLATPGMVLNPANASTSAKAVATIRAQHAAGADFIKAGMVGREVFFDAQAEALRLGLPIVGHLPAGIDVAKASRRGMKSIEHLGPGVTLFACCCDDGEQIRELAAARPGPRLPPFKIPFQDRILAKLLAKLVLNPINQSTPQSAALFERALTNFDETLAHPLAERFAADATWQVPTLIRVKTQELCDAPGFAEQPGLAYMTPGTRKAWSEAAEKFGTFPEQMRATFTRAYELQLRLTKIFDEAGVEMLAGTDSTGAAWVVPGAALHQEFDELARAGLSALRILQMATVRAAQFLGATATMGTIEPEKNADLVLLTADPTASVENLHRIAGVVRAGRYFSQQDLLSIKDRIAAAHSVW